MTEPVHIISLGAGVQSSTMALMAAAGELTPMPVAAIFADTQAEPASVYRWLDWLETQLPFPVYRITAGNIYAASLKFNRSKVTGRTHSSVNIPLYTLTGTQTGKVRQRNCTRDFKILPIMRLARKLGGIKHGQKTVGVVQWIGISRDEASRMKPSRDRWCESRWPLIEAGLSRDDCLRWMVSHGYPTPPRSACVFCPFHNNHEWRRLRDEEPEAFAMAVQFEKDLQSAKVASETSATVASETSATVASVPYLHRSCVPLPMVDLSTAEERGQVNLFQNECEGMCGV